MEISSSDGKCPKCSSWNFVSGFNANDVFEERGSKLVRKRGAEFIVVDNVCFSCGHKWSTREFIKGVAIRRSPSVEKEWLQALSKKV